MSFTVSTPNHNQVVSWISQSEPKIDQLRSIIMQLGDIAGTVIMDGIKGHIRTGATVESIQSWVVSSSGNDFALAVGSLNRGNQLRWLDKGRGEVRPVKARMLRYWLPSGAIVFSRYSRATVGIGFMAQATSRISVEAPKVIQSVLNVPYSS
jgi:hypothetical protein